MRKSAKPAREICAHHDQESYFNRLVWFPKTTTGQSEAPEDDPGKERPVRYLKADC